MAHSPTGIRYDSNLDARSPDIHADKIVFFAHVFDDSIFEASSSTRIIECLTTGFTFEKDSIDDME